MRGKDNINVSKMSCPYFGAILQPSHIDSQASRYTAIKLGTLADILGLRSGQVTDAQRIRNCLPQET